MVREADCLVFVVAEDAAFELHCVPPFGSRSSRKNQYFRLRGAFVPASTAPASDQSSMSVHTHARKWHGRFWHRSAYRMKCRGWSDDHPLGPAPSIRKEAKHDCVTGLDRDRAAGVNHAWNS